MFFDRTNHSNIGIAEYKPWLDRGVLHGFCNGSLDFSQQMRAAATNQFCKAYTLEALYLPRQEHTDSIHEIEGSHVLDRSSIETLLLNNAADGILVHAYTEVRTPIAIGVLSADCVPALILSPHCAAVIHSGWRGIAQGIVAKACQLILSRSAGLPIEVLLGPCAGAEDYEVGAEVISSIGSVAVARSVTPEKSLLDLAGSIKQQVQRLSSDISVSILRRSTMRDHGYHSFRRDGEVAGRNLSFIVLGAKDPKWL